MKEPLPPPIDKNINTYINPTVKLPTERNVTVIAINIPNIPNKFPCLDVSGEDNPLKAKINNTPEIRYKIEKVFRKEMLELNYL